MLGENIHALNTMGITADQKLVFCKEGEEFILLQAIFHCIKVLIKITYS